MAKDTFISWSFLLLWKKKHLFRKLQLFSQNTGVLHFPEDFYIYQGTIDKYNNLQITIETPERRSSVFIVTCEQISHLFLLFLLLTQVNTRYGWLILRYCSCVSNNYYLSSRAVEAAIELYKNRWYWRCWWLWWGAITRYIWFSFMIFISLRWGAMISETWLERYDFILSFHQ